MKKTRTYTQTARAEAAERTRLRILDAAVALAEDRLLADISLDAVASAAQVSVQTVLRRFGSRAGLFAAAREHALADVAVERAAPVGDPEAAVAVVVDHYEARGDAVLLLLAQEHADADARAITEPGRRYHRSWTAAVFGPLLPDSPDSPDSPDAREEALDLLAVATDVHTWAYLRRHRGLSRAVTEQRIRHLVAAVLA